MDEENSNDGAPTTSKGCKKTISGHVIADKKDGDEDSIKSSSLASSYSATIRLSTDDVGRTDTPKSPVEKTDLKVETRRKRVRGGRQRRGRVQKRKRSVMRRNAVRKPKRRTRMNRLRDSSVTSILSRLSPRSPRRRRSPECRYCSNCRCCRRYCHRTKRVRFKRIRKNKKQERKQKRMLPSESVQVGSRCVMLSPLFVKTNLNIAPQVTKEEESYLEITPEMIHESLRRLTMWREGASTNVIMDYIKRNYPVDPDSARVLGELRHKLQVAVLCGIVSQMSAEVWRLSSALEKRQLSSTHVTLFWKMYSGTMSPVAKREVHTVQPDREDTQTNTALLPNQFTQDDSII